jgi:hypothetical protein
LHAYLEGQNIELMANSDNVLRGGLTPKHIDIEELIKHVQFVPTYPKVLLGDALNEQEIIYPCPVADFGLTKTRGILYNTYPFHRNVIGNGRAGGDGRYTIPCWGSGHGDCFTAIDHSSQRSLRYI